MLGNAGTTQFDLRFRLFGIPVRVHPLFWLVGALLWWIPHRVDLTLVGIACVFVSILVHELGHAVMYRRYGHRGEIVLYMMGGYATGGALSTWKNIIVSAAGPGAGFLLFALVFVVQRSIPEQTLQQHQALEFALFALTWINLWWGIVNLTPCLPLDGGRIMEALVYRYSPVEARTKVLKVSAVASGLVALGAASQQQRYVMILFGLLCFQSVSALNQRQSFR